MAYESKWLKASKALEEHICGGPWAREDWDADYQLYQAVMDFEVQARIDGKIITDTSPFRGKSFASDKRYVLPFNMEVNMEDVRRIWNPEEYDLADTIARGLIQPAEAKIRLETINENLTVLCQSVETRLAAMSLEKALIETRFRERFAALEREHRLLIGAKLLPKEKSTPLAQEFNSFLSGANYWFEVVEEEKRAEPPPTAVEPKPEPPPTADEPKPEPPPQKRRGGRKPKYDWPAAREHVFELLREHGLPTPEDPDWAYNTYVERAVQQFFLNRFGCEPVTSLVREHVSKYIAEYKATLADN